MFSEHEKMILKIIGRRKMKIQSISEEFFHSHNLDTDHGNYVAGVVRRITEKCVRFKLTWTLHGKGVGRGGRTIWRGKRKANGH